MLTSLYLRNFVIVSSAELTLHRGLTTITGETGAGKSVLIDALSLVLGGRAGSDVVRHGEDNAEIIASFDLSRTERARRWLSDNALDSDGECILRRVIRREGNSRGFINGRPVTMQQLRELGNELVDIHGQHEHQSLLRRDAQRQILDDHAGLTDELNTLAELVDTLAEHEQQLAHLQALNEDGVSRLELLRYQVDELDQSCPSLAEIQALEEEHRRLANASDLIQGTSQLLSMLSEDDNVAIDRMLGDACASLQALEAQDPALADIRQMLDAAGIQLEEAINSMRHYLDRLEIDPERLAELERVIATLHDLARKHHVTIHELPDHHARLKLELEELESGGERIARLEADIEQLTEQCLERANTLSQRRSEAAMELSNDVTARMQELGMEGGRFHIDIEQGRKLRRHGLDNIEFLVSANPGQPLQPLKRVASGGELSRIALALQVTATEQSSIPTLVFDEIDVGIGGRVAEIVGRLLNILGADRQVLCITHLAQVAAYAQHQLKIRKSGEPVEAEIELLGDDGRIEEIARMMGGIEITEQTLATAREMLRRASG